MCQCVNLYLSTVKNSSGLNYIRKKVISKSEIHYHIMLITMLKLTNPNKNLFSMNAVPYFKGTRVKGTSSVVSF